MSVIDEELKKILVENQVQNYHVCIHAMCDLIVKLLNAADDFKIENGDGTAHRLTAEQKILFLKNGLESYRDALQKEIDKYNVKN